MIHLGLLSSDRWACIYIFIIWQAFMYMYTISLHIPCACIYLNTAIIFYWQTSVKVQTIFLLTVLLPVVDSLLSKMVLAM